MLYAAKGNDSRKRKRTMLFLTCAFIPESSEVIVTKAGLLTRFVFWAFPSHRNSGVEKQKIFLKLTASGNVQDLHLIPFSFRNSENL